MKPLRGIHQKFALSPEIAFLAVLGGSTISFFTTWRGLRSFMGGETEFGLPVAISLGVTALIQLLLVVGVYRFILSRWRAKPFWLAVYLLAAFFSIVFATGFWVSLLEGDDLARHEAEKQLAPYLADLQQYVGVFQTTAGIVDALRVHSIDMAVLEETKGTSCGYETPAVQGPRYRLRMADADVLGTYGPRIVTIGDSLQAISAEVSQSITDFDPKYKQATKNQIRDVIVWARATRTDPALTRLINYLNERTKTEGRGITRDGVTFDCPDQKLQALGTDVVASAGSLPEIRDPADIDLFGNDGPADAVRLVLNKASGGIMALFGAGASGGNGGGPGLGAPPPVPIEAPSVPRLPIILGCIVDLFIFLMALSGGTVVFGRASLVDRLSETVDGLKPESENAWQVSDLVFPAGQLTGDPYEIVSSATERIAGNDFVMVLPSMASRKQEQLSKLMDLLVCAGFATPEPRHRLLLRRIKNNEEKPSKIWLLKRDMPGAELRMTLAVLTKMKDWSGRTIESEVLGENEAKERPPATFEEAPDSA